MQLIKLYSNQASFRTVQFNKTGLSLILAKQKEPEETKKGKTYNGVGKSLIVRIIHFCLGSGSKNYNDFHEKLIDWDFYLDFSINNKLYTTKRSTKYPNKINLNNEELKIEQFNQIMAELCFYIPIDTSFLTFRSLIPFFIRPSRESYLAFNKPGKTFTEYQSLIRNAFLLGIDIFLVQEKYTLRKEKERIEKLEKNFKDDTLLKDFFTGNKDVNLTVVELDEKIERFEKDLAEFKVAEDYYKIQVKANEVEKELRYLNNDIVQLKNVIDNIKSSLTFSPDLNNETIKPIYNESKIHFSDSVSKNLDDLENFYKKLIINRKDRLSEHHLKLEFDLNEKEKSSKKMTKELDELMLYLGEHQALDLFVFKSSKCSEYKTIRNNLLKYQELQSEYKNKERQLEKELFNLNDSSEKYLKSIEQNIIELRDYFRHLAKIFYPNSIAGLTIDCNEGNNQLCFNIDAKIESDGSDGINSVKIFCYDLTLLFKGHHHKINFIFHDTRLFSEIDERQKSDLFRIVYEKFNGTNKQYIATINQNQFNEIKGQLDEEEFKNIMLNNIILTLTDDSDSEKLLGIKVDLRN